MPPRLNDRVTLVTDQAFASRVSMAAVTVAFEVMTEPADTDQRRISQATAVLNDPIGQGRRLTAAAVADEALAALAIERRPDADAVAALDEAIQARLRDVWDALAGIPTPAEPEA